ncbi:MAG: FAD-dependent monooxygenase [Humibacillus sp.]|nr:FAD-dependent monooxygenase [Humibacillus sp.]MDN5777273.1 FAD-dependent monooxygenase [Humibacillus sp.]
MSPTATVVGAGVAGLATAIGLERLGWEVTVLERASAPREDGAGLTLWPNAMRALDAIGAAAAVRSIGMPASRATIRSARGREITQLPIAELTARYGPMIAVHRAELTRTLSEHLSEPIRYGSTMAVASGKLLVDGRAVSGTLIVGADGIDSSVREVVTGVVHPRQTGQFAARGVARTGSMTPAVTTEYWGRGLRFGLVPLRDELIYWFAATRTRAAAEHPLETFAGWHHPVVDALEARQVGSTPVLALQDLPALNAWHDGRSTALVGDAAHAMTPNLGQGAAQALEDVAALLDELGSAPVPEALAAYELHRRSRAEYVVSRSRLAGRVAQAGNPLTASLRDALARATPARALLRQFATILEPSP